MQTDCAFGHVHFGILNTLFSGKIMRCISYFATVTHWKIMDKLYTFS